MGTIIVGIDFSKGSIYALRLAVDIANRCGYDVHMVYVSSEKSKLKPDPTAKLEELSHEFQSKLTSTKLFFSIKEGGVSQELIHVARTDHADMIVIGAHGESGYKEQLMGDNTYKIISDAKCPVLTVRETFNFDKKLEKIVLPIDSSDATRQKIPFAANMAKIFGSEVYFLGLYTSKLSEIRQLVHHYVLQGQTFLSKEGVRFKSEFINSENTTISTLQYAESINADLIIIMTEQEKRLFNMFKGSFAKQLLNMSPIPVLSIGAEEINRTSR